MDYFYDSHAHQLALFYKHLNRLNKAIACKSVENRLVGHFSSLTFGEWWIMVMYVKAENAGKQIEEPLNCFEYKLSVFLFKVLTVFQWNYRVSTDLMTTCWVAW